MKSEIHRMKILNILSQIQNLGNVNDYVKLWLPDTGKDWGTLEKKEIKISFMVSEHSGQ